MIVTGKSEWNNSPCKTYRTRISINQCFEVLHNNKGLHICKDFLQFRELSRTQPQVICGADNSNRF